MKNFPFASVSQLFDLEIKTFAKPLTENTLLRQHLGQTHRLYQHLKISHLSKEVLTALPPYVLKSNPRDEISALYRYTIQTL